MDLLNLWGILVIGCMAWGIVKYLIQQKPIRDNNKRLETNYHRFLPDFIEETKRYLPTQDRPGRKRIKYNRLGQPYEPANALRTHALYRHAWRRAIVLEGIAKSNGNAVEVEKYQYLAEVTLDLYYQYAREGPYGKPKLQITPQMQTKMIAFERARIQRESERASGIKKKVYRGRVYLVYSPGNQMYKIGRTTQTVAKRLSGLRTSNPDIELVHSIDTDSPEFLEKTWHDHFERQRVAREWFQLTNQDVETFIGSTVTSSTKVEPTYTPSDSINTEAETAYNEGNAKSHLQRYEEAIVDYTKAISLDPNYANAYLNRGTAKSHSGRYEEAIADFDKTISLSPKFALAYYNRGSANWYLQRYEEAIADYDKAISLDPNYADAYQGRGTAKLNGRYEEAIADFDKTISLDPNYANAYYNRGLSYERLGEQVKADQDFAKAKELEYVEVTSSKKAEPTKETDVFIARNGDRLAIDSNRALAEKCELNSSEEAIAAYDNGYDKVDDGMSFEDNNDSKNAIRMYEEAIAHFDKAITLDPNYAHAYYARGTAKAFSGRHQEAIADYNQAIDLGCSEQASNYESIGESYVELGLDELAVQNFAKANELGYGD